LCLLEWIRALALWQYAFSGKWFVGNGRMTVMVTNKTLRRTTGEISFHFQGAPRHLCSTA
jgi:hypothetical protein